MIHKNIVFVVLLLFVIIQNTKAQTEETVEATINLEASSDFVKVSGIVFNPQQFDQRLLGKLTVSFDTDDPEKPYRDIIENRFVILPGEKLRIAETSFPPTTDKEITLFFIVFDANEKIVGKKRIVLNKAEKEVEGGLDLEDKFLKELAKTSNKPVEVEKEGSKYLAGLIFEDTRTKPGQDFYREFSSQYLLADIKGPENITIKEFLATGRNTRIDVMAGTKVVWQFFARPQIDYIRQQVQQSLRRINVYFQQLEKQRDQLNNN